MKKPQSLDDLFNEAEAEAVAKANTPEALAEEARRAAERAERKDTTPEPQTPFDEGLNAQLRGEDREAPEGYTKEQAAEWLDGFDSEVEDE